MSDDFPNQDLAAVKALAEAVHDMTAGMPILDAVQALASVITTIVCDMSKNRETARAVVDAVSEEMLSAVNAAQRPGWPTEIRQ